MFYFLSKLLPLLVYPLGLACLLLILSLLLHKHKRGQTTVVIIAIAVIALAGNRLVGMSLARSLEWRHPALHEQNPAGELPTADVIVVLGGGTRQRLPPRPFQEVGEAGDRMIYAAKLYRDGVAPKVLVSGAHAPLYNPGEQTEAEAMAELLAFFGVPESDIIYEGISRNTYENAVESAKALEAAGLNRVILVTSALHMPRAYAVFRQTALDVVPAPADYLVTRSDWSFYTRPDAFIQLMNLLPDARYLEMTQKALKEYIGIVVYGLRGWL
jgi:uncharacterized SAM-binding protein YcdF (DUF218 family)